MYIFIIIVTIQRCVYEVNPYDFVEFEEESCEDDMFQDHGVESVPTDDEVQI